MKENQSIKILYVTAIGLLTLLLPQSSLAQTKVPCLEKTITISVENKSAIDVLHDIEKMIGCNFSFNSALVQEGKKVTVKLINKSVRQVLDKMFAGTLQYKEKGGYIILTKAEEKRVISGYVENEKGEKVAGASVYDLNTLSSATSNEYGYYEMKMKRDEKPLQLSVSKDNFSDTIIPLQPSTATLQNVVIHEQKDTTLKHLAKVVGDTLRSKWSMVSAWTVEQFTSNENVKNIKDTLYTPFQFSVVPFVGTNGRLSGNIESDWSFNLFGGYNGGVRKAEFGTLFNVNRNDVRYFQLAGLTNVVGGNMTGVQFGGLTNLNFQSFRGFQIGGLLNLADLGSDGASVAGLMNITGGKGAGLNMAGLMNIHGIQHDGMQLAGLMNINEGQMNGIQVAGFMNLAEGKVRGSQIAGFMNAADTMNGMQISGFLNIAHSAKGVQLGFINLSDTLNGVPIGFFSYVKTGYHKLELAYDELNYGHLSFRSGTQYFYNILGVGISLKNVSLNNSVWTFGYGVGTAPRLSKKLALNVDITGNQIFQQKFDDALNVLAKLYLGVDYNFIEKCSITAGLTFNGYFTENNPNLLSELEYLPKGINEYQLDERFQANTWIGWRVGLRFF